MRKSIIYSGLFVVAVAHSGISVASSNYLDGPLYTFGLRNMMADYALEGCRVSSAFTYAVELPGSDCGIANNRDFVINGHDVLSVYDQYAYSTGGNEVPGSISRFIGLRSDNKLVNKYYAANSEFCPIMAGSDGAEFDSGSCMQKINSQLYYWGVDNLSGNASNLNKEIVAYYTNIGLYYTQGHKKACPGRKPGTDDETKDNVTSGLVPLTNMAPLSMHTEDSGFAGVYQYGEINQSIRLASDIESNHPIGAMIECDIVTTVSVPEGTTSIPKGTKIGYIDTIFTVENGNVYAPEVSSQIVATEVQYENIINGLYACGSYTKGSNHFPQDRAVVQVQSLASDASFSKDGSSSSPSIPGCNVSANKSVKETVESPNSAGSSDHQDYTFQLINQTTVPDNNVGYVVNSCKLYNPQHGQYISSSNISDKTYSTGDTLSIQIESNTHGVQAVVECLINVSGSFYNNSGSQTQVNTTVALLQMSMNSGGAAVYLSPYFDPSKDPGEYVSNLRNMGYVYNIHLDAGNDLFTYYLSNSAALKTNQ
jgi:hypothetical protein